MTRSADLLGRLALPLMGAPLFIVSGPELVIAQCRAGVVGSFPSLNARPGAVLAEWIARIREETRQDDSAARAVPYAVNLIVHRSNDRIEHDLAVCVKHRVPMVITSLGARPEVNDAVHGYGGFVWHDVVDDRYARKAIEKGADGLIAVAAGAGGHAGRLSPFALVAEIRSWFAGPVALSGAIATGGALLAARAMGADLGYVGSAFIATEEANAATDYKRMITEDRAADIVLSDLFTGVHGNYLRRSIVAAGLDPDDLPRRDGGMDFSAVKAWRDVWGSGQGIGAVDRVVTVADLVARLEREYRAAREALLRS